VDVPGDVPLRPQPFDQRGHHRRALDVTAEAAARAVRALVRDQHVYRSRPQRRDALVCLAVDARFARRPLGTAEERQPQPAAFEHRPVRHMAQQPGAVDGRRTVAVHRESTEVGEVFVVATREVHR